MEERASRDRLTDASQPRHEVEVRWDVRVPVRDGLHLSANLWLPKPLPEASGERFPAILEMIPYGKDSWRRNADTARGEWLAARGFALCRLDVRGTGSSPGIATDEYAEAETLDGYDAVEWLAARPWCIGNVGMWGISYGGFTALQVASLRPPHLRAILPVYASDDRYRDDVHFRGGCVTASEKSQYAVSQLGMNALPPRPAFRGTAWREEWRQRLEETPPWLLRWIREQTDGPYWRRGSLAPDYDALDCAVFQVAGWCDSYVDAAFRIQARCVRAPVRTLVGNWSHSFPDDAYPGPNLDWLHELVRFFDRYLKGIDNGWEREPAVTWFEHQRATPEPFPATWPGRWRAAGGYPAGGTRAMELRLGAGTLTTGDGGDAPDGLEALPHRATVGTSGGLSWGAGWHPNGLARDLRPDEARSLVYTGEPLAQAVSILGVPEVVLHLTASMPVATCVVRLSEVTPDGASALVATGALNLTHRLSDEDPSPMPTRPRATEEVRIPLRTSGYRFAPGNRIRLAVMTSYWPALWPSPFPGELRVHHGPAAPSRLLLPMLPDDAPSLEVTPFRTEPAGLREVGTYREDPPEWRIEEDVLAGRVTVTIFDGGESTQEDGSRLHSSERLILSTSDEDPAHTRIDSTVLDRWTVDGVDCEVRVEGAIASDAGAFDVRVALVVRLDGEPFFAREWSEVIARNLV